MKVSYRREMKHNYMIIDPEEIVWRSYECQMMESNVIDGLLRFQMRQSNGETRFYYEITSRQPLGRLLENRAITGEEIRRLVIGISKILDQIERYLLDEGSLLLKPDTIYVDPDTFCIWLCLVPGLKLDFPDAYGALFEYILGKVNHQDKNSVVLAYGLYQETRKENFGIEDMLRFLQQNPPPAYQGNRGMDLTADEEGKETQEQGGGYGRNMETAAFGQAAERPEGHIQKREEVPGREHPDKKSIWFRIKSFFAGLRGKKQDDGQMPEQLSWQAMFLEDSEASPALMEAALSQEGGGGLPQTGSFPPSSDFVPTGQGTVLLSDHSPKETLRKLKALDSGESDITLSYYPFVIGKQENMADYILNRDTVSRLHLRIDRIGEDYQVMDLNSTNGTVVRGAMLENNEAVPLYPGDEIQIARYRFRFE